VDKKLTTTATTHINEGVDERFDDPNDKDKAVPHHSCGTSKDKIKHSAFSFVQRTSSQVQYM